MNLSIFEKLSVVFELLTHSPIALMAFLLSIFLFASLLINLYIDKKYVKVLFPIGYLLFLGILLLNYRTNIIQGFQLFIDDLFLKTYFPSVALYFTMLIVNAGVLFVTIFLKKVSKFSKILNMVSFSGLQFLFALFLLVVSDQKIALSEWETLYQNKEILSILEVSMGLFLIWLFLLVVGFGLNMINRHCNEEETVTISLEQWQQLDTLIKKNMIKLSDEVEHLKRSLEQERTTTLMRVAKVETELLQTKQLIIDQIQEVTGGIHSQVLLEDIQRLEELVTEQQQAYQIQLTKLAEYPHHDQSKLEARLSILEDKMSKMNQVLAQQLALLKVTPQYEIDKLQDQFRNLELLMKRYIVDMNRQLLITKKEFDHNSSHRQTYY